MKASKYTVLIIPDNSENNRSFLLTRKSIRFFIIATVIFIAVLVSAISFYGPKLIANRDLQAQYDVLLSERTQVMNLMRELNDIRHMDSFVRKSLGADLNLKTAVASEDSAGSGSLIGDESEVYLSLSENLPSVLPVDGFVTREINEKSLFTHENHYGLDIAVKEGTPVKAAASGFVLFSGWTYNMGNYIILYHFNGYFTIYGHNLRNLVAQRDYVKRSDVIALAGNTGISSGPHLHFEVWKDGGAIDPKVFFPELNEKNVSISKDG